MAVQRAVRALAVDVGGTFARAKMGLPVSLVQVGDAEPAAEPQSVSRIVEGVDVEEEQVFRAVVDDARLMAGTVQEPSHHPGRAQRIVGHDLLIDDHGVTQVAGDRVD